jgi:excisionase family DNA binding protein
MTNDEYVTLGEATEVLGVSRFKVWQLVREGVLPTFVSPLDRRQKLVRREDLDQLRHPVPSEPTIKKLAA